MACVRNANAAVGARTANGGCQNRNAAANSAGRACACNRNRNRATRRSNNGSPWSRAACCVNRRAQEAARTSAQVRNDQRIASESAGGGCGGAAVCPTTADEIYGGATAGSRVYTTCCDPGCPCRRYPVDCRDPFWPTFAHPRWLCCSQLYSGRRRG